MHKREPARPLWPAVGIFLAMAANLLPGGAQSIVMPSVAAQVDGWAYYGLVFTISTLATAIVTPVAGKLGEALEKRTLILAGLCLAVVSNLAVPLCPSMELIVLLRFVSGVAGALITTPGLTLIGLMFPGEGRVKWMGYYGMLSSACNGFGPVLGGLCTDWLGWQWIYILPLPLGLAAVLLLCRAPRQQHMTPRTPPPFDWLGLGLLSAAMALMTLLCQLGGQGSFWQGALGWGLCLLLLALAAGFVLTEGRRGADALLSVRLFRSPLFSASMAATFLTTCSAIAMFTYLALYLQRVAGLSPSLAGIPVTVEFMTAMLASPALGHLMARTGRYRAASIGAALVMAALSLYYSAMGSSVLLPVLIICQILYGLAACVITSVYLMAVQEGMPDPLLGQATAGIQLGQTIGGTVGAAVMGAVASAGPHVQALPRVFQLGALLALLAVPPSLLLRADAGRARG